MPGNGWPHPENIETELNKHFVGSETNDFVRRLDSLQKKINQMSGDDNGNGNKNKMSWSQFIIKLGVLVIVLFGMGFIGYRKLEIEIEDLIIRTSPWLKDKPYYENRLVNVETLSQNNRQDIRENSKEIRDNTETLRRVEKTTDKILDNIEHLK